MTMISLSDLDGSGQAMESSLVKVSFTIEHRKCEFPTRSDDRSDDRRNDDD